MNAVAQHTGTGEAVIRSFHVSVPDADLTDLRRRISLKVQAALVRN